jgi:hypothetical protein
VAESRRATWVDQQAAVLREELSGLGLTITDDHSRALIRERREQVAQLMRITARSAQRHIDDDATRSLAHELAFTLADEQPGADLTTAPRTSQLSLPQLARLTTGLAEAAQSWLHATTETPPLLDLLSCVSLLGIFTSDTVTADLRPRRERWPAVAVPPALLTRAARCLETSAQHVRDGGYPDHDATRDARLAKALDADATTLRRLATG